MSVWTCDPDRFAQLASEITAAHQRDGGIGTLGEKSIHAVLKYYFDENPDTHERSVGTSVADIVGADGVIEIQTRQFHRLNAKLTALLPECPVTVVYPVIRRKRVTWIDPETGEALRVGTFRKFQTAWAVFPELARILPHITHPHFRLVLAEMEAEGFAAGGRLRRRPANPCDQSRAGCRPGCWRYGSLTHRRITPHSCPPRCPIRWTPPLMRRTAASRWCRRRPRCGCWRKCS